MEKEAVQIVPEVRAPALRAGSKEEMVVNLLRREGGATIAEIQEATGWKGHTVRGCLCGALKKKKGLNVVAHRPIGSKKCIYQIIE